MPAFTRSNRRAADIMPDDWFKLGSQLCRVKSNWTKAGFTTIEFEFQANHGLRLVNSFTVPSDMIFKIFNQE